MHYKIQHNNNTTFYKLTIYLLLHTTQIITKKISKIVIVLSTKHE